MDSFALWGLPSFKGFALIIIHLVVYTACLNVSRDKSPRTDRQNSIGIFSDQHLISAHLKSLPWCRETGKSIEATALEHLQQQMAPAQQQTMLEGFRTFADHFKSQLQQLVESNSGGEDYVVTAQDVNRIVEGLKQK